MATLAVVDLRASKTAAGELRRLADRAEEFPEKFQKFVLVYYGDLPKNQYSINHAKFGCTYLESLGLWQEGNVQLGGYSGDGTR